MDPRRLRRRGSRKIQTGAYIVPILQFIDCVEQNARYSLDAAIEMRRQGGPRFSRVMVFWTDAIKLCRWMRFLITPGRGRGRPRGKNYGKPRYYKGRVRGGSDDGGKPAGAGLDG